MDEITEAINNLSVASSAAVVDGSASTIINSLSSNDKEELIRLIADSDLVGSIKTRLKQRDCSVELVVQLIAEIAKTDVLRHKCSSVGLISLLLNIMSSGSVSEATQACRAMGNICFDNDVARLEVSDEDGLQQLFGLLREQLQADSESARVLRKVACGFFFNLINTNGRTKYFGGLIENPCGQYGNEPTCPESVDSLGMFNLRIKLDMNVVHESLIEKALSLDGLKVLSDYIQKFNDDESLLQMVLLAAGLLADSDLGRSKFIEYGFVNTLLDLLISDMVNIELQLIILDLFASLSENDDVKLLLANADNFNTLIRVMTKPCLQEDLISLQKATCDLIVLVLTGDESMNLMYDNGKGKIISEAVEWMKSSNEHLQNSGALAIGNIARSDEHCVQLVQLGITTELLALLEWHPVETGSSTVHHAVFSALRNLAIPAANKPVMLKCQLLEQIMPYLSSTVSIVSFKILCLLRMIVEGQELAAVTLGTNASLVQKVADWCNVEDHQGVRGEANRFVASLVKNSRSVEVMRCVAASGALKNLAAMSASEYVVMQNEALIALTLIATTLSESIAHQLVEANLSSYLKTKITEKTGPVEVLRNTLTLVKQLSTIELLSKSLTDDGFPELLLELRVHSDEQVKMIAKSVAFEN